ncbi:MAG: class I SAM-dependent methyltransferase, partial [Thermoplasmataceae archaeon]
MQSSTDHLVLITANKSVPLAYAKNKDEVYVVSSGTKSRWPSEILRIGHCKITIDGIEFKVSANLVTESAQREIIMDLMRNKYGKEKTKNWFSEASRVITLEKIKIEDEGNYIKNYNRWLKDEFDAIAEHYDHHIYGNYINNYLRERSVSLMKNFFNGYGNLLEIGSGTGTETLEMLRSGHRVTAIDISDKMNQILMKKAKDANLDSLLITRTAKASEIAAFKEDFKTPRFDGIYSNYGALNCERDLDNVIEQIDQILRPGGRVVLGIYNKICVSEMVAHVIGIKPGRIFERLSNCIMEGNSRFCIDVFPYSP